MPSLNCATIIIKILDGWINNHVAYVLCEIADKLYLLEREF